MFYPTELVLMLFSLSRCGLSCDPSAQEMHICLHIYLERDFPLLEELLKQETPNYMSEGKEFEEMCSPIKEMERCYDDFLGKCSTYPFFSHLLRVIYSIRGVYRVLCSNSSAGLKDVIKHGHCIESVRAADKGCKQRSAFDFPVVVAKMMRFDEGRGQCEPMMIYKDCLRERIREGHCGEDAANVWTHSLDAWLDSWCHGIYVESIGSSSSPSVFTLLLPSLIFWLR